MAEDDWLPEVRHEHIDVVTHCAYRIRELHGDGRKRQGHWNLDGWNLDGACRVFEFALAHPSVRRVVHLSTISPYGALPTNSVDRLLTGDPAF